MNKNKYRKDINVEEDSVLLLPRKARRSSSGSLLPDQANKNKRKGIPIDVPGNNNSERHSGMRGSSISVHTTDPNLYYSRYTPLKSHHTTPMSPLTARRPSLINNMKDPNESKGSTIKTKVSQRAMSPPRPSNLNKRTVISLDDDDDDLITSKVQNKNEIKADKPPSGSDSSLTNHLTKSNTSPPISRATAALSLPASSSQSVLIKPMKRSIVSQTSFSPPSRYTKRISPGPPTIAKQQSDATRLKKLSSQYSLSSNESVLEQKPSSSSVHSTTYLPPSLRLSSEMADHPVSRGISLSDVDTDSDSDHDVNSNTSARKYQQSHDSKYATKGGMLSRKSDNISGHLIENAENSMQLKMDTDDDRKSDKDDDNNLSASPSSSTPTLPTSPSKSSVLPLSQPRPLPSSASSSSSSSSPLSLPLSPPLSSSLSSSVGRFVARSKNFLIQPQRRSPRQVAQHSVTRNQRHTSSPIIDNLLPLGLTSTQLRSSSARTKDPGVQSSSDMDVDISLPVEVSDEETEEQKNDKVLFTYPVDRSKGSITITVEDQSRLEPSQFLNDSVIDFYLKWLMDSYGGRNYHRRCTPLNRRTTENTHIFSSFFYNRLTRETDKSISYANVKKWTSDINLFSKKYAIFPINEYWHWYLVLVINLDKCIPGYKATLDPDVLDLSSGSESDELLAVPHIFVLDSLGGRQRKCINNITEYLSMEAKSRLDVDAASFIKPKFHHGNVPKQDNSCDCGVFLLHFVDQFLSAPEAFIEILMNKDATNPLWKEDKIKDKRDEIKELFGTIHTQYLKIHSNDMIM